jgi:hypothetical protein
MNTPVSWMTQVEKYLAYRRHHGFKLSIDATQLQSFARFADEVGPADHLTVALAIAWARSSQRPNPLTWARRIDVLRGFARFCLRDDPATEMPPRGLFGPAHRRLVPHIYQVPKLGGQQAVYLANALQAYKTGARSHPTMRAIAASLSEQDMADLAAYYSTVQN